MHSDTRVSHELHGPSLGSSPWHVGARPDKSVVNPWHDHQPRHKPTGLDQWYWVTQWKAQQVTSSLSIVFQQYVDTRLKRQWHTSAAHNRRISQRSNGWKWRWLSTKLRCSCCLCFEKSDKFRRKRSTVSSKRDLEAQLSRSVWLQRRRDPPQRKSTSERPIKLHKYPSLPA